MKVIQLSKKDWVEGLELIKSEFDVFAPATNQNKIRYKKLNAEELPEIDLDFNRCSPKALIFPQSEKMFQYTLDETKEDHHVIKPIDSTSSVSVILSVKPCDAASFLLSQKNFDTLEYKDTYWINAYNSSIMVGLACDEPESTCFCTSVGFGPYSELGLDLLLIKSRGSFIAKILSSEGEKISKIANWQSKNADETIVQQIEQQKNEAESKVTSVVQTDHLKTLKSIDLFDAPFWDDVSFACLNCGICTYGCPTCWCFDIQDETLGKDGIRCRNWDSCMFPLYSKEGSGHNPRAKKTRRSSERVKQRFLHKFKYFLDKYDSGVLCVGCGRCITQCPVNIDIRNVCMKMNNYQTTK